MQLTDRKQPSALGMLVRIWPVMATSTSPKTKTNLMSLCLVSLCLQELSTEEEDELY